ncbi:MAG: N-acetyltransferase [Betaproteobacteria bacterium]|nr:N-acetyltransferase [Betaproteobacteria bacterium]
MKLDIFIAGEAMDLRIPTREFAETSDWYSWFNDPQINRYLDQGVFPNDVAAQIEFLESQKRSRLLLIISNKKQQHLGVISLSAINIPKRSASVALVVNSRKDPANSPVIALEAMARITEHGFAQMGLDRIVAGQHEKLAAWQQRMELLGFRLEGISRRGFVKGRAIADSVSIAAHYDDYLKIVGIRGKYWDSSKKMMDRFNRLPKEKFVAKMKAFLKTEGETYYRNIFGL